MSDNNLLDKPPHREVTTASAEPAALVMLLIIVAYQGVFGLHRPEPAFSSDTVDTLATNELRRPRVVGGMTA